MKQNIIKIKIEQIWNRRGTDMEQKWNIKFKYFNN